MLSDAMSNSPTRVLALDIRARRLGYVVLEGPESILDFGVRSVAPSSRAADHPAVAARKAVRLALYFRPDMVLVRGNGRRSRRNRVAARDAFAAICADLHALNVEVRIIREGRIVRHFRSSGCTDRYRMAELLASRHPVLAWHLPPKRKPWQSEQAIFMVFDAATLAAVHFDDEKAREERPELA